MHQVTTLHLQLLPLNLRLGRVVDGESVHLFGCVDILDVNVVVIVIVVAVLLQRRAHRLTTAAASRGRVEAMNQGLKRVKLFLHESRCRQPDVCAVWLPVVSHMSNDYTRAL